MLCVPLGSIPVHFNLPRRTLDAFTDDNELHRIGDLPCTQGIKNDVLLQLTKFVLPWLGDERRVSNLMFDYFVWMFCSHIAASYGQVGPARTIHLGGLAPWQKRRLVELIDSNLDGELRLSYLAEQCGLSVSHLSRSFKRSFGVPVHRYLIARRVERAKFLLRCSSAPLSEIALESGFSDQAAFSRTFRAVVGTSPMRWLNERMHRWPDLAPAIPIRESVTYSDLSPMASRKLACWGPSDSNEVTYETAIPPQQALSGTGYRGARALPMLMNPYMQPVLDDSNEGAI